jgi:hypothetical protein
VARQLCLPREEKETPCFLSVYNNYFSVGQHLNRRVRALMLAGPKVQPISTVLRMEDPFTARRRCSTHMRSRVLHVFLFSLFGAERPRRTLMQTTAWQRSQMETSFNTQHLYSLFNCCSSAVKGMQNS